MPGGSNWSPDTTKGWMTDTAKRLTAVERRKSSSYRSRTQGGWADGAFPASGAAAFRAPLELLNGWYAYRLNGQAGTVWDWPAVKKTSAGIVQVTGFINPGALASGTVITVLPEGCRPDTRMSFLVSNAETPVRVDVAADGSVILLSTGSGTWLDLASIIFPAAGVASWTPIGQGGSSFAASVTDFGNADFGVARFWKDAYDCVWYAGAVKSSAALGAADVALFTMPASHGSYAQMHMLTVGNGGIMGIGTSGDFVTMNFKTGFAIPANAMISLAGLVIPTAATLSNPMNTRTLIHFVNGWANYNTTPTTFTQGSIIQLGDGLTMSSGLLSPVGSSTNGSPIFALPEWQSTSGANTLLTFAANAKARLDIYGRIQNNNTTLNTAARNVGIGFDQVGKSWYSLDNIKWIPD